MARQRKTPTAVMNEAEQKIAGMKSIKADLNAGNGVTVEAGETVLAEARAKLAEYNESLAVSDAKKNEFEAADRSVRAFNKKVLPAVGLLYGLDSTEYEKAGGVRESERKKRVSKPKPPTA